MEENIYLYDGKIDTTDEGLNYWANEIKCDLNDLKNAVKRVGERYSIVILFLEVNRQIKRD